MSKKLQPFSLGDSHPPSLSLEADVQAIPLPLLVQVKAKQVKAPLVHVLPNSCWQIKSLPERGDREAGFAFKLLW